MGKYLLAPPEGYRPPGWGIYEPYLAPMNKDGVVCGCFGAGSERG